MSPLDRLERLTDLVLVLLNANRPMTLAELADDVPGYPSSQRRSRVPSSTGTASTPRPSTCPIST